MRPFRSARLVMIPTLVALLALSTLVASSSASARGAGSKTAQCMTLSGTYGGSWSLYNCSPPAIVGIPPSSGQPNGTISSAFPTSPAVITWGVPPDPRQPPLTTKITFSVRALTAHKDKCGAALEYALVGSVVSNSRNPGVKGHVKMFVCDAGGALSQKKKIKL
jgi:hypothetical protein